MRIASSFFFLLESQVKWDLVYCSTNNDCCSISRKSGTRASPAKTSWLQVRVLGFEIVGLGYL